MLAARRLARKLASGCLLGLAACAPPAPPAPTPAPSPPAAPAASPQPAASSAESRPLEEEAEPALVPLRTGRIQPIEHAEPLGLSVRQHAVDGDQQLLEIVLPEFAAEAPGDLFWWGTEARLTGSSAPFQLVGRGEGGEMRLWLRRASAEASGELVGDVYTPAVGAQPGHHFRFRAPAPSGPPAPELPKRWAAAASEYLAARPGAFGASAAARLRALYKLNGPAEPAAASVQGEHLLTELMEPFTGSSTVHAALALNRSLALSEARRPRTVPITQVTPPRLAQHPWERLLRGLGKQPPSEPLASAVPADFYFVRARSFIAFTELLSYIEGLGAPAADAFERAESARGSLLRYLTELGVETSDLSRVLGPEVVEDFALTGSDPYLHQGSDLTLVFRVKSPTPFRAALAKALATHGVAHGGTQASTFRHEGVEVDVARSPDGRVRQHRASVQGFELVSNSPSAMRRVISAVLGKAPRLADELDFRYMTARDAEVAAELFAFIGDRFVASLVGPARKIAEARRHVAHAELTAAPTAALLFGWLYGRSPTDRQQLLRSRLLAASELTHHDGARIDWTPGSAPRSTWGSPAALEPLIDLPAVTRVSDAERSAYASFASQYEMRWGDYIDPIALRLSSARLGDGRNFHAELRVLPFVRGESAARFDVVGDGRVAPPELGSGARLTLAIGQRAPLRNLLDGLLLGFSQSSTLRLDWLGDYALVGVADRTELLAAWHSSRDTRDLQVERPASAEEMGRASPSAERTDFLAGFPVYAAIGLRSRVATAVALAAAKQLAESAAPGTLSWAPFASHRGVEVVRILSRERGQDIALYYALVNDTLLLSLNRSVMRSLVEQALEGKLPPQGNTARVAKEGQVVLELSPAKRGPLRTLLAVGLALGSVATTTSSRATAEAVLRGVPESAHQPERSAALALAYFGVSALTPDGRRYALAPEGLLDPLRGSAHAPEWPALPSPQSPAERALGAFGRLRSDLTFEDEPGQIPAPGPDGRARLRSLRARVDLTLR
jgi:hypothetical protein